MRMRFHDLICCFCGISQCKGAQWWNRDEGYGTCNHCAEREKKELIEKFGEKEGKKELRQLVGDNGIHYNAPELPCFARIRNYKPSECIPTSEDDLNLPDLDFPIRWIDEEEGNEDEEGFQVEIYFRRWIKALSIDFEEV